MLVFTDSKEADKHKAVESVVESLIQPKEAHVSGDRGNPHYAKQLEGGL